MFHGTTKRYIVYSTNRSRYTQVGRKQIIKLTRALGVILNNILSAFDVSSLLSMTAKSNLDALSLNFKK
jgi:hypothetical protein